MTRLFGLLMLLACTCVAQTRGSKQVRPLNPIGPVIVELFTSEGCSSCPQADRLLGTLDGGNVIVLGEHVDYWDGLGWKDPFSSPLFTSRQQDYGEALRTHNVYTPQVVVQGQREVSGTDARAIANAVSEFGRGPRAVVSMSPTKDHNVLIEVGKLPPGSHRAEVLLAVAESGLATDVLGGENVGRRLQHAAVVRSISKLAELDPARSGSYVAEAKLNLRPEWKRENLKLVLLVQDTENRHILGAMSFRP